MLSQLTTIKSYTTTQLQKMRQDLIKCAQNEMNAFSFTVNDIDDELEYRAQNRIPSWDVEPHTENAFL